MERRAGVMIGRIMLSLALAFGLPGAAWAQTKPDFTGTWKLDKSEPSGYAGAAGSRGVLPESSTGRGWAAHAPTLTIKQTGTDLTIESTQFGDNQPRRMAYKLDGSETETPDPKRPDMDGFRWLTKARWEGGVLTLYTYQGWNQMVDRLSLSGGQLTISREISGQTGGSSAASGPHKLVYSKTSS
jgi:hypothetical protein